MGGAAAPLMAALAPGAANAAIGSSLGSALGGTGLGSALGSASSLMGMLPKGNNSTGKEDADRGTAYIQSALGKSNYTPAPITSNSSSPGFSSAFNNSLLGAMKMPDMNNSMGNLKLPTIQTDALRLPAMGTEV